MNIEKIKSIITDYKNSFCQIDKQERYKWEAIKCFQDNWNPQTDDVEAMLKAAMAKAANLLNSKVYPYTMLLEFAHHFPEDTRQWFISLFDESIPLQKRIGNFLDTAQTLRDKRFPDQPEKNHFQDTHAVSVYLTFRYPEKYYFYKFGLFESVARWIGFGKIPQQGKLENLPDYFEMAEEIRRIVIQDEELKKLHFSRLDKSCYDDRNCTVLTQDIILFAQKSSKPKFRIWKMSLGPGWFTRDKVRTLLDKNKVSMGPDTLAKIGSVDQIGMFEDTGRSWDVVYICHGNQQILRLALFAPENAFEDTEDLVGNEVWTARRTVTLANAVPNNGLNDSGKKYWWYPTDNSTFIEVKEKDWPIFEEKILRPFFDMSLDDLSEQRTAIMKNDTGEISMSHYKLQQEIRKLIENKLQVILTGAPGTGKTYLAREVAAEMISGKNISSADCLEEVLKSAEKSGQYQFIQFHPGYDYSDFVEGLKPRIDQNSASPEFSLEDGIFKKFCMAAADAYDKAPDKKTAPKYVMVIDEINRADLSRVFGELFYGLEKGYRGKEIRTQYDYLKRVPDSDEFKDGYSPFVIPPNLYLIGTMNDIDRSVESMDFALRRRFGWREISWEESQAIIDRTIPAAANRELNRITKAVMASVNNVIIKDKMELESAYALGGAYFKDAAENGWDDLWNYSIRIILNEYLRGNRCNLKIDDIGEIWKQEVSRILSGGHEPDVSAKTPGNAE